MSRELIVKKEGGFMMISFKNKKNIYLKYKVNSDFPLYLVIYYLSLLKMWNLLYYLLNLLNYLFH